MNKKTFYNEPKTLELLLEDNHARRSSARWIPICKVDMEAAEDHDLSRVSQQEYALSNDGLRCLAGGSWLHPVQYYRCVDLAESHARWIQTLLSAGETVYFRLKDNGWECTPSIREIYQCAVDFEELKKQRDEHVEDYLDGLQQMPPVIPASALRWMITSSNVSEICSALEQPLTWLEKSWEEAFPIPSD